MEKMREWKSRSLWSPYYPVFLHPCGPPRRSTIIIHPCSSPFHPVPPPSPPLFWHSSTSFFLSICLILIFFYFLSHRSQPLSSSAHSVPATLFSPIVFTSIISSFFWSSETLGFEIGCPSWRHKALLGVESPNSGSSLRRFGAASRWTTALICLRHQWLLMLLFLIVPLYSLPSFINFVIAFFREPPHFFTRYFGQ